MNSSTDPSIFENGFEGESDLFRLKPIASGLTKLVSSHSNPLVLAINGQWGSGKSIFLKQWKVELERAGYPVIYFDAFENDYVGDAFAALAREVLELLTTKKSILGIDTLRMKMDLSKMCKVLAASGAKIALKAGTRAVSLGTVSSGDIADVVKDAKEELEDLTERMFFEWLQSSTKDKEIISEFKAALSLLPSKLSPPVNDIQKPLIFIIDELDRCKPTFALELLERMKHFMSVENVHFVLGVNLVQLRHSVRSAYGNETDAQNYLQKFINVEIRLPEARVRGQNSKAKEYIKYLNSRAGLSKQQLLVFNRFTLRLEQFAAAKELSLRTIEKIYDLLKIRYLVDQDFHEHIPTLLVGLSVVKITNPSLYDAARNGNVTFAEITNSLGLNKAIEIQTKLGDSLGEDIEWWQYLLDPNSLGNYQHYDNKLPLSYPQDSADKIIPWLSNECIGKIFIE